MQVLLLELFPAEVVRIVRAYAVCQKCCNDVKGNYNLCTRCLYFDRCLGELFSVSFAPIFFLAGPRKLNIPILYKLQKPKRATLRLQCALYETFFSKPRHPFLFSSTECFPIVQTRCHREKYVFDHTKNVRNTAFVYSCGGFLLFASFLFFPLHEDNLLRWTGIFAFACLGSTLYSLVKLD